MHIYTGDLSFVCSIYDRQWTSASGLKALMHIYTMDLSFSLGAETRTQKNSPHKCLIQILII